MDRVRTTKESEILSYWKRHAVVVLVAGGLLAFALSACGLSTRLIDVEIEVFRSWGILEWGRWEPLRASFVSMEIEALAEEDRVRVASTTDLHYVFRRAYSIEPVLGSRYRVALTNRTEHLLGVVLAIDGLNTNDGVRLLETERDKKWVLLPDQTVRIAGWQVTDDQALAFLFGTPSQAHSPLDERRGEIRVDVYLPDEGAKGTAATSVIDQPTIRIPFTSATAAPVETVALSYVRENVSLGILCEETTGAGIRISQVVAGTVAELKGLRSGDIVTYVSAVPVNSCGDLQAFLATRSPGDRVVLKVHREDRAFLLTLELAE